VAGYLRDSVTRYFASGFFHDSSSPKLLKKMLGLFGIFLKIIGDIHKSRCTTGIKGAGGKFAIGVNDTGGKFAAVFNNTSGKMLLYQRHQHT
jgi:hypothetical protein